MSLNPQFVTVVIPVFGCRETVGNLVHQLMLSLAGSEWPWEILLIVDGESDAAWKDYKDGIPPGAAVRMVRLSRNFGQHSAIRFGIGCARPGAIVILDCDLQDPPEIVPVVLGPVLSRSADIVLTERLGQFDEKSRQLIRRAYSRILASATRLEIPHSVGPVIGLSDRARQYVNTFSEDAHLLHILQWLALPRVTIGYERSVRPEGASSYSLIGKVRHGLRGLVFSASRLMGTVFAASFVAASASIFGIVFLAIRLAQGSPPSGWLSILSVAILGFALVGMLLSILGGLMIEVLGLVRNRPAVVVADEWRSVNE